MLQFMQFIGFIVSLSIVIDWVSQIIGNKTIDGLSAIVIAFSMWYLIQVAGGIQLW